MPKICKVETCNNQVFARLYCKFHQYLRKDTVNKKPKRSKIKAISDKQKQINKEYHKLKKEFMKRPENKKCIVAKTLWNEDRDTVDIHHCAKRGYFMLVVDSWLAVSRDGHIWIEANTKEAEKHGWMWTQEQKRLYKLKNDKL